MTTNEIITLALKHAGSGNMVDSAVLCLSDAIRLESIGMQIAATQRALKSLDYSIGVLHEDYIRASNPNPVGWQYV